MNWSALSLWLKRTYPGMGCFDAIRLRDLARFEEFIPSHDSRQPKGAP
jgi:hypothetical protein